MWWGEEGQQHPAGWDCDTGTVTLGLWHWSVPHHPTGTHGENIMRVPGETKGHKVR